MTSSGEQTGVWVSDVPLEANQGGVGNTFLTLDIPEAEIAPYERYQPAREYREFLVPAEILNSHGPPKIDRKTQCC